MRVESKSDEQATIARESLKDISTDSKYPLHARRGDFWIIRLFWVVAILCSGLLIWSVVGALSFH